MNIGIVTTWFERGAAYVSKAYLEALSKENNIFIFARDGELQEKNNPNWDADYVTWGKQYFGGKINKKDFFRWINKNCIDCLFFNEQREYKILAETKKKFPQIKLGAYVDYYTEDTIALYDIYDFLICNTKRHLEAFSKHKQVFYVRWGADLDLFRPLEKEHDIVTFFHSVGMSSRKGTDLLVEAYLRGKLYEISKLVIHTQIPIEKVCKYNAKELSVYGIDVIEKTVTAPGLYYLGDVYVYPTRLDGLGLTLYEAIASGLPVITTDYPPMNEVIDNEVGRLVKVRKNYCRTDAYYWPLAECDINDLIKQMYFFVNNQDELQVYQNKARKKAEELFDWKKNSVELNDIFKKSNTYELNQEAYIKIFSYVKKQRNAIIKYIIKDSSIVYAMYNMYRKKKGKKSKDRFACLFGKGKI